MSANAAALSSYSRSTGQGRRLVLDPWLIGTVAALLLVGLVMVASASIGIAEKETGHAFYYFQRQVVYVLAGLLAAALGVLVPTRIWEKYSIYLLGGAFVLLLLVLIPGLGYEVNGARRWVRLGFMNFQVSELARVMLLTYIASYAVRRADEMRSSFVGFMKPVAVLVAAAVLLLIEPDFGAATVLLATGLAVLFLAGARIHHLLVPIVFGIGAHGSARGHVRLPPAAPHRVPQSLGGSVRQRLPARAVADRDRPRRVVRRRAWARACRSSSTCPSRTPISCSRCWPRNSGSSASRS